MSAVCQIVGVDPGLEGAIAVLDTHSPFGEKLARPELVTVYDMPTLPTRTTTGKNRDEPDLHALKALMEKLAYPNTLASIVVEEVNAAPGQGVVSMFRFGMTYGAILMAAVAAGHALYHVRPQEWKRAVRLMSSTKDQSRKRAAEIYPAHAHLFARKRDDGRAEAVLIAYAHWLKHAA